jgi:hypothetical protein
MASTDNIDGAGTKSYSEIPGGGAQGAVYEREGRDGEKSDIG